MTDVVMLFAVLMAPIVVLTYRHAPLLVLVVALVSLALPIVVLDADPSANEVLHPGLTSSAPRILAPTVVMLATLLPLAGWPRFADRRPLVALLAVPVLVVLVLGVWDGTPAQWSGAVHLSAAAVAWVAGARLSASLGVSSRQDGVVLATVLGILVAQLLLCALQVSGTAFAVEATDQGLSRARGSFGHAGDLGKVVVALMALVLPWTVSVVSRLRWTATAALGVGFLVLGTTLSRANILAGGVLIVVWAFAISRRRFSGRAFGIVLLAAAASIPFLGTLLLRFRLDPDGGSRPELLRAAFEQLGRSPWWGTGPNSYVEVVGQYDAATASGLPVHNALILLLCELGLVLFVPIAAAVGVMAARAFAARRTGDPLASACAAALLACLFAGLLIAVTGWGMLKGTVLLTWVLVPSLLYHRFGRTRPQPTVEAAPAMDRHPHDRHHVVGAGGRA
ncbi:O-antigen ligase family protein [Cellulosimicrobium sp. Marseille-Q4280]|jgi:O-antigen ligase|uniref:O-antigen ligase family protein n=1 Tax=Cellulosimicrobium sp. Marseille-Q4280 TaxID=2937992 RepID=UPI00203D4F0D|nr:O-antigen ligase family protein [Cellulosimicrobium sp. Marseille-Q4280]